MADKETIIGPATRVAGELRGDEDVVVRGRVEGRVQLSSTFTVEDGAIIQADVEARVILISGVVVGNLTAVESIRLAERARVVGDIVAPRVVMEEGATYKGRLEMGQGAEASDAQARAAVRRSETGEESGHRAPPRLSVPSRVAATPDPDALPRISDSAPSLVAAPMPPRAPEPPPSLPAPEEAAAGGVASAPAWAKKKLHRRT